MIGPKAFSNGSGSPMLNANKADQNGRAIGIVYGLNILAATFKPSTALKKLRSPA